MSNVNIPLVLLPGMMCDYRLFAPQLTVLQESRDVFVAHMNHGNSVEKIAEAIFSQVSYKRFALAGLSMGGIIAMEMVRQKAESIVGLALMDTNPWAENDTVKCTRKSQIEAAIKGDFLEVMKHQMAPKYGGSAADQSMQLSLVLEMAASLGKEVFINQSIALRDRPEQIETLKKFSRPSIVMCGEEDLLCPLDRHQTIMEIMPNCQLHIIPNAGHLITLQKPITTTKHLADWLETLS